MYRNPLNNGDISDYNSLKKQRDYGAIIKKYQSRKLKTQPNELQKYYQYMTYQQPILDELNYVAERMKNENIQKKKEDFNFIEDLKIKREQKMKEQSVKEKDINNNIRNDLFDYNSTIKNDDMTPTINTDIELNIESSNINYDNFDDFEVIEEGFDKKSKNQIKKEKRKEKNIKKYEEALNKYGLSTDISNTINRPIIKSLPEPKQNEINKELFSNITKNLPISNDLQTNKKKISESVLSQADTEIYSNIPRNKRGGGRPKGSKNKPKRTLDLTK